MANLKAIRRRITSIRSTQKITRAMKMVAAARLRRSQEAAQAFRPYADVVASMLANVAEESEGVPHPLLQPREKTDNTVLLVFSSDRGLCGGFNANLCRFAFNRLEGEIDSRGVAIIGKKAKDYFERRPARIDQYIPDVYDDPSYENAALIARNLADRFVKGEVDKIELVFNEFVSMVSQRPTVRQLLPVVVPESLQEDESHGSHDLKPVGMIFEPSKEALLEELVPKYVEVQVYRALLETIAAEHAARMTAMDAATNNAEEMLNYLTLVYNRARQSAITSELMDIVGGAEALNE